MNNRFVPNIPRYFVYTAIKGFGFGLITAIWVIYLQQRRGLSLTQATIVDMAFWIAATLGEVPAGIVADAFGRKTSLAAGAALLGVSTLAWAFAPTMPLIMLAYVALAVGTTFLSGAEEAFLYESLQIMGRTGEYARLVGRVSATMLGATALGNVASGPLATIDLILPFLIAGLSLLIMLGIVLTFKEPQTEEKSGGPPRKSYGEILRQSLAMMRARPPLRYPMIYLALVPLAAVIMETFFLQPQAVSLGVPLAGVGVVVMAMQITNMAGSTWSDRIQAHFGERRVLYTAPVFIVSSLILLAAFQLLPALLFIAVIGFVTAVLRPLVLSHIQNEVPDDIRATILSMQSLMFTLLLTISEPILGFIADQSGLPAAYVGLAGSLSLLILFLFWKSRHHFPQAAIEGHYG
ncbi:MAG: MFS transporter [Chloroflexi bacterium]|nr:MFS transporter [Chloroflexota bacterium]